MDENIEKVLAVLDGFRMSDEMTYSAYSVLHDEISMLDDLLKEREPRVMTLEEVQRAEIVYIEEFADPKDGVEPIVRPCIIVAVKNGFLIGIVDQEEDLTIDFFLNQYGIDWRCWTSRPTDEQREATPWQ